MAPRLAALGTLFGVGLTLLSVPILKRVVYGVSFSDPEA